MVQQRKKKEGEAQGQRKVQQRQKATGTTGTTTAITTTKEENASAINRLDKETHSKDNVDMAKEKDTTTKEKAKDTTTTNKEEKEQGENKRQMFATDVDNQDTWPSNAGWRSTTVTQEPSTPMTRQMTGTTRHTTTTTGVIRISHRCSNWFPQPPQTADPSSVPISGLHEVTVAMIGATQQTQEDNKWVNLMIDSGALHMYAHYGFASQFPLHQLAHGTGPQLRTVANQHIKLHGYRWGS